MRAIHWLIGCTLCMASITVVAATNADRQDTSGSVHAGDLRIARENDNGGGTSTTPEVRNGAAHGSSTGATDMDHASDHGDDAPTQPLAHARMHLGWQSLLPGSIQ